jgi:hypothetical protein
MNQTSTLFRAVHLISVQTQCFALDLTAKRDSHETCMWYTKYSSNSYETSWSQPVALQENPKT